MLASPLAPGKAGTHLNGKREHSRVAARPPVDPLAGWTDADKERVRNKLMGLILDTPSVRVVGDKPSPEWVATMQAKGAALNGRKAESNGKPAPAAEANKVPAAPMAWEIIRDFIPKDLDPEFRRRNVIHSRDGRMTSMTEWCGALPPDLIDPLKLAKDAPTKPKSSEVDVDKLPGLFRRWAGTGWKAALKTIAEEDAAKLGDGSCAAEEFRRLVREALLSQLSLGEVVGPDGSVRTERRSVADWLYRFSKGNAENNSPWQGLRSFKIWCKRWMRDGGEFELRIALRVEFFSQVKADRRLCEMNANTFSRRCERYRIGTSSRHDRPGGQSAVVLDQAFVMELTGGVPDEPEEPTLDI